MFTIRQDLNSGSMLQSKADDPVSNAVKELLGQDFKDEVECQFSCLSNASLYILLVRN